jgi:hypothetical protein
MLGASYLRFYVFGGDVDCYFLYETIVALLPQRQQLCGEISILNENARWKQQTTLSNILILQIFGVELMAQSVMSTMTGPWFELFAHGCLESRNAVS